MDLAPLSNPTSFVETIEPIKEVDESAYHQNETYVLPSEKEELSPPEHFTSIVLHPRSGSFVSEKSSISICASIPQIDNAETESNLLSELSDNGETETNLLEKLTGKAETETNLLEELSDKAENETNTLEELSDDVFQPPPSHLMLGGYDSNLISVVPGSIIDMVNVDPLPPSKPFVQTAKGRRSDAQHYSPHIRQQLVDAQLLSLRKEPVLETVTETHSSWNETTSEGGQSFHLEFSLEESMLDQSVVITSNETVIARTVENTSIVKQSPDEQDLTTEEIRKFSDVELRRELQKYKVSVPPLHNEKIRDAFRAKLRKYSVNTLEYSSQVYFLNRI